MMKIALMMLLLLKRPFTARPHLGLTGVGTFITALAVFGLCLVSGFGSIKANASAQSRRVVTDSISGYAIFGYDPVAYFTDHAAIRGKREYEYVWNGVSWLFASRANLEVFKADPEVYAPAYGGHGALAMSRGYASECNPSVWALYGDRLFLFYTYTSRAAWAEAVDTHVRKSDKAWTTIEGTLSR